MKTRGRPKGPNRAHDPLTRAVVAAVDRSGLEQAWVSRRAGLPKDTLSRWRTGMETPRAASLALVLEAIGLDLRIVDRNAPPDRPIRLPSLNAIRRAVGRM